MRVPIRANLNERKHAMTNEEIQKILQTLIGTTYEPGIKETIKARTGRSRVLGPQDIATREFDVQRIQVIVDETDVIKGFSFG